uniref:nucleoside diphosphate phosphatase n=1 Tax=Oncorhynchus mykiss TaxID=8022 RepID=A0A8K9V3N6_ONCMY
MSLQAPLQPAVVLSLVLVVLALTELSRAQLQPKASVLDFSASLGNLLPSLSRPANSSRIFYGVMFDAGSTGTRIHVYTFIQKDPEELPVLDNEMFHSVKPGLSAYADMPEIGGYTVRQLLKVAKKTVPQLDWKRTPLVLKATAGFRLLPPEKAHALLEQVQDVFDESPFFVPDDSVSIMDGTNEGILAWVTVNFLTGHLYAETRNTVGILDLGGGSTQITFLPKSKKTIVSSPADYIYPVSVPVPGYAGYKLCYQEVLKVVKGIVHQPYELKDTSVFYAFSYYFDRAVDAGLIDGTQGGMLEVRDFKRGAKEVCNKMSKYRPVSPFLCMDMTYITCLLKDGFGFKENTVLQLTKKVNNIETSWALGATFKHFQNLKIH